MKVIILAAGQSNRVSPIPDKNFISFCGKPLIEWQIQNLAKAGVEDVIIVGNKGNLSRLEVFAAEFKDKWKDKLAINVIEQKKLEDGMAGAVIACKELIDNDAVLIVSSNDVVDQAAYKAIIEKKGAVDGALLGYKVKKYFPGGYMQLGHGNKIEGIVEKPGEGNEPSDFVNIVVHLHANYQVLIDALEEAKTDSDDQYEVAIANMIRKGKVFEMVPYKGFWQALKFPWHIFELDKHFLERRGQELDTHTDYEKNDKGALIHKTAQVDESAVIKGDVIIEADVKVFENAVISGPAYIGEGSIIANQSLTRGAYLGKKCVVGFITEIARSHLGDNVWTHSNYIGDSIIGNNVSFGAGAVTANLRLDEGEIKWQGEPTGLSKLGLITGDHIRVGVNATLMPGLAIGSNVMIGGGITIAESIEDNEFVYGKITLQRKKNKLDVSDLRRS